MRGETKQQTVNPGLNSVPRRHRSPVRRSEACHQVKRCSNHSEAPQPFNDEWDAAVLLARARMLELPDPVGAAMRAHARLRRSNKCCGRSGEARERVNEPRRRCGYRRSE